MNHLSWISGRRWLVAFAAFVVVCIPEAQVEAQAQTQAQSKAQTQALVQDAWARPTVQGQTVGGAYFRIDGGPIADRLLAISADIAQSVELHTMRMDGDVMRMRQLDSVDVPVKQSVEFKPGGMHVMLIGLKTPLRVGNNFPMTLRFEKAGSVSVNVRVLPAPPAAEHKH
jgi:copper(I)-binding protein